MPIARIRIVLVAAWFAAAAAYPTRASAQEPVRQWEPRGFDFSPDGVWRKRARQVAALRAAALARGDFGLLNSAIGMARGAAALFVSPGATPFSPAAVTGVLKVPVILFRFKDTNPAGTRDSSVYNATLFGTVPPAGRNYTYRSFYEEMSHGLLSVQGAAFGWFTLDSNMSRYTGPSSGCQPYGTCNGIWSGGAFAAMQAGLVEAVHKADATVDFSQYDSDGDGIVDLVVFIQPAQDGACVQSNDIWSHRASVGPVTTNDPWPGHPGLFISIRDYTIQSGVGGTTACDASTIMPIGTLAHETGHGFGLFDLYDTSNQNEGIGEWGLMSSGNYATPLSPVHMEGFSLSQLGWVTVAPLTAGGTYHVGAVETGDSVMVVRPSGPNPRGEYFMLENRQPLGSDVGVFTKKSAAGGLFVWHVDSTQYSQGGGSNSVNAGAIHALTLEEADGDFNLLSSTSGIKNRGDAGDPYPGTAGNTAFVPMANPAPVMHSDGRAAGLAIDSITQVVPNGEMTFRLRLGQVSVVAANDTAAQIRVRGTAYRSYTDLFSNGDTLTISVDSLQTSADGRTRFTFGSWSDALARTHVATFAAAGTTLLATLGRQFQVTYATAGPGTVASSPAVVSGSFFAQGDSATLTATAAAGKAFSGWAGDTIAANSVLKLRMNRPFSVIATFQDRLAVVDTVLHAGVMGADYADTLVVAGGNGVFVFTLLGGTVPPGITLGGDGTLTGTAAKDGTFNFTVHVVAGIQTLDLAVRVVVTAPALAVNGVVNQFLSGTGALTTAEIKYLDLLGNNNGLLDIGDFTAWLDKTGNVVSADVMRRIAARRP